jgi:hypothetical protein
LVVPIAGGCSALAAGRGAFVVHVLKKADAH